MEEESSRIDGIQLEDISSGSNLPLSGRTLYAAQFDGADLSDADFTETTLTNSSFVGATLDAASFDNDSDLTGTDLTEASLRGTKFLGARLENCTLTDATAYSVECPGAKLMDTDLSGANLDDATFTGANLRNAVLNNAILRRANFVGCNLENANLAEADLRDCSLVLSMLKDADVRDVIADHRTNLGESLTKREQTCIEEVDNLLPGLGYRLNSDTITNLQGRCWYELIADTSPEQLELGRLNSGHSLSDSNLNLEDSENGHKTSGDDMIDEPNSETNIEANRTQSSATNLVSSWWERVMRKFRSDTQGATEQLEIAAHVYRDYQRIFSENHLSRKHRIYRIRQGHAQRKHQLAAGHSRNWIKAAISRWTFLYGESPSRVVLCSGFLIAFFAGIYPIFGIKSPSGVEFRYQLTTNINAEAFLAAIQVSLGQFFGISSGGYTPIDGGNFVGQLQLVVGTIFISLFIFTLGRRATN
ncbi:pentapeptide repeat-containing protein [Haladaptatus sp. CMAA 1911]|uniref:pentapeptide repeat-containing protein n=1 Tax=unclassified Haladaptatus TaxID=2622732 RepID=UPI0037552F14